LLIVCASVGRHEEHLVLRSPVNPVRDATVRRPQADLWQDVVNKNSTERRQHKAGVSWDDRYLMPVSREVYVVKSEWSLAFSE
jgi:hypothetical protein